MTGEPQDIEDIVSRDAFDWLLRLNAPQSSAQDAAKFAVWLNQSDAHRAAYREAERVWILTGALPPLSENGQVVQPLVAQPQIALPKLTSDRRRNWRGRALSTKPQRARSSVGKRRATIVAAFIAACIAILLVPQIKFLLQADYRTGIGVSRHVRLADGTEISLNAESAIAVNYTDTARQVILLAGEAFVKVAPDPKRPFSLTSKNLTVSDIGTVFDVDLKPSSVTVSVQEGEVAVDYSHIREIKRVTLKKEDRLRIDLATGEMEKIKTDNAHIGAWRSGQLLVDAAPIGDVVEELQRYHRGVILLRDEALAKQRVSGVYDLRDPIHALRAVVEPYAGLVGQWTPYLITVSAADKK